MKTFLNRICLTVALLLSALTASAYDFEVDGIQFTTISFTQLEAEATGLSEDLVGDVVIPATVDYKGKVLQVIGIGKEFAFENENITKLKVEEGVLSIANRAFYQCANLKAVSLPTSLKCIGTEAFRGCCNLIEWESPGVTIIDSFAFADCTSIPFLNFPILTEIPLGAFSSCSLLSKCTTPNITKIGEGAFYECSSIREYECPKNTTDIGNLAFYGCSSLETISFTTAVDSIHNYAFAQCSRLESVSIPNNVRHLGEGVFDECASLTFLSIGNGISILYPIVKDCVNLQKICLEDSDFPLVLKPSGISEKIENKDLYETTVQFSKQRGIFDGLPITEIYIGRNIQQQPYYKYAIGRALHNNDKEYYGLYYCYDSPFSSLPELETITYGPFVTNISTYVDEGTSDSEFYVKGNTVGGYFRYDDTYYGGFRTKSASVSILGGLENNIKLCKVDILGTSEDIPPSCFRNCSSLTTLTVPFLTHEIKDFALEGCSNLEKIEMGLIKLIGKDVLKGCDNLSQLYIFNPSPPKYESDFSSSMYLDLSVIVPEYALNTYKTTEPWSNFWNLNANTGSSCWINQNGVIYQKITDSTAFVVAHNIENPCELEIPLMVNYEDVGLEVERISPEALKSAPITSLTIPSSIKSIGKNALKDTPIHKLVFLDGNEPIQLPYGDFESSSSTITEENDGIKINFKIYYYGGEYTSLPIEELYIGRNIDSGLRYSLRHSSGVYMVYAYDSPFNKLAKLRTLKIGEKVGNLGLVSQYIPEVGKWASCDAFSKCNTIETVDVAATIPPVGVAFASDVYETARLIIPIDTERSYKEAEGWKEFMNIIEGPFILIESLSIEEESVTMDLNSTSKLTWVISPQDASIKELVWESSDLSIVEVSSEGILTSGNRVGEAVVTATTIDGSNLTASVSVKVVEDSGVEVIQSEDGISIEMQNGVVYLSGKSPEERVNVYDVQGRVILSTTESTIPLTSKGVYVIKMADSTFKIIL